MIASKIDNYRKITIERVIKERSKELCLVILFCGVVMSHYTHYNLSSVTQEHLVLLDPFNFIQFLV